MAEITVDINTDGSTQVAVTGEKGVTCTDLTAALEKNLGSVKSTEKTSEYHERKRNQTHRRINQR